MLIHGINDNIIIPHPSYLGVFQDEAKNESSNKISMFLGGWNKTKKTDKREVHGSLSTVCFFIIPMHNLMGAGCSGIIHLFLNQILMEKLAPQNGWFFIRFLAFTRTLVYSIVWDQSLHNYLFISYFLYFTLHIYTRSGKRRGCHSPSPPPPIVR